MSLPDNSQTITIADIREARFYAEWMNEQDSRTSYLPGEGKLHIIQQELNNFINKNNISAETIVSLEKECAKSILHEKKFRWLIKNKRATFWAYYYIFNCGRDFPDKYQKKEYRTISERIKNISRWKILHKEAKQKKNYAYAYNYNYKKMDELVSEAIRNLNRVVAMNHDERYEWIVSYFDYRGNLRTQDKEKNLSELRSKWEGIIFRDINLGWIDVKNRELCRWAYKYLAEKIGEKTQFERIKIRPNMNNSEELYDSCQLIIDQWENDPDALRFLLLKLQKAWSQKKLRDSRKDMKAINVYISTPVKTMLDSMVRKNKTTQTDLIEELVRKEYFRKK